MELLTGTELEAKEINSNFTMSVTSDVPLPFKTSTNLSQVYNLLREMPARISNCTEEKGVPVSYTLTPLTLVKRVVLPNSDPSSSAIEVNDWVLKDIVSHFDEITSTEKKINNVHELLYSHPNCLLEESEDKIDQLQSAIHNLKGNFSASLKKALQADRSGSGDGRALLKMSQKYRQHELTFENVKKTLSEFKSALKRTAFCAKLEASHPQIEYIGREQNFYLKISQHFNQSVYVLFTKAEFTNSSNELQENLSTFLNELNQPGNKLYIVDCDFEQAMCLNVSESVIHLYRNGRLISPKVERVYEEEVDRLQLQISQLNSTLANMSVAVAAFATVKMEVTNIKNEIITQRTRLTAVNSTAGQNQNNILLVAGEKVCEVQKPAFIADATKSASLGCGGTIQLPSEGESIVLDFNLTPTNGSATRCLWTFDATQNNELVWFKVKMTLLCKQPPQILDENTLALTEWYGNGTGKGITTNQINSSSDSDSSLLLNKEKTYRVFLSFNAKATDSAAGFVLRVDVLHTLVLSASSSSATHKASHRSASYSLPSSSSDFSSIVINPQTGANLTLAVDVNSSGVSNPCEYWDSVDILEFGMDGVPKELGRLCGRQSSILYETENPVAALFYWRGGFSGRGVTLSWK